MTAAADRPDLAVEAEQVLGLQVGDHGTQINYYAGRPAVTWPHLIGVVPPLAQGYQVRSEAQGLDRAWTDDARRTAVLTQVLAGMGGVGKTQLAAADAHRQWQDAEVDLLMWVSASSRDSVLTVYAQAGADLVDPPAEETVEQRADRLLAWLSTTTKRWLLVLDDLADPADLDGLWPTGPTGQVLVTTRRRDASLTRSGRTVVEVGLFTEQEARAYLVERLDPDGTRTERLEEADGLISDLGRLPLALAQAGSYMLDRDLTCKQYRQRLAKRRLVLVFPEDAPADEYASTVAATTRTVALAWSLSTEAANSLPPRGLALPLLGMASVLSPNGIPTSVFDARAAIALLRQAVSDDDTAADYAVDADDVHDALSNLHRLSLLTRGDGDDVRVHALVQRATREQLDDDIIDRAARAAADALIETWPEQDSEPGYTLLSQVLRDNTEVLLHVWPEPLWTPAAHPVLFRSGESRNDHGLLQQALSYWSELTDRASCNLGPEHPDTLTARDNQAGARLQAGDPAGAMTDYDALLLDLQRLRGPKHSSTLVARCNRAFARLHAGDPAGAMSDYDALLPDLQRLRGPEHPTTLQARSNRAGARLHAGDPAGAMTDYDALLPDLHRLRGPEHPTTLQARSNRALARLQAGDPVGAMTDLDALLPDLQRLRGPQHPDTLVVRSNRAFARLRAGDPVGAITDYEALLPDLQRAKGPEHPNTLQALSNRAGARLLAGDPAGAFADLEDLIADLQRVIGPEHPTTVQARSNRAFARLRAGDPVGAITDYEALLLDLQRMKGPVHPDTLRNRNDLASAYRAAGRLDEALPLYERAAADTERQLGPAHPRLAVHLHHLGQLQQQRGDLAAAEDALARAVTVDTAAHGPDHPEVARDLDALAEVQQELNVTRAKASRSRATKIRSRHAVEADAE